MTDSSSVLVIVSYLKLGLCGGVDERELGVVSLQRLFLSRLLHPQLCNICSRGYVSFGCLSFGFFPLSVGEILGKASSSWWLGEILSLIVERLCIQGVWTEQRFPLLRFEVPGFWSYRLAGEVAAISVVWVQKWRVPGGGL
ncbi:unnamed protein product [Brassica napus]|uniref:(rape) hypothetical protein n=1 Tax=Brassica napus TaxID=3708 RepID=A0A816KVF3_BRANA|nr:unnamed protein product [Brassica napus]